MAIDEAALQRLIDKDEIREVALKYTRGIDRHDDDIMREAYHPDARDDHGEYIGDPDGFIHYAANVHATNWRWHQHYITNQFIELNGPDTAHGEIYFFAVLVRKDGGNDISGGRYIDRYEKRDGKWAVADRICMVEWSGIIPEAEAAVDYDTFIRGTWDRADPSYLRPLTSSRANRVPPQYVLPGRDC